MAKWTKSNKYSLGDWAIDFMDWKLCKKAKWNRGISQFMVSVEWMHSILEQI